MARKVRDSDLGDRTARLRLKRQHKPHWRAMSRGKHVGYYRPKGKDQAGAWIARQYKGAGRYEERRLGTADDNLDADGRDILDFDQAQEKAREWFTGKSVAPAPIAGPMTVRQACESYVEYCKAELSKKQADDTERRFEAHVYSHAIAEQRVANLGKKEIERWRNGLVRRDDDDLEVERRSKDTANRCLTMLRATLTRAFNESVEEAERTKTTPAIPSDVAWRLAKPFKAVGRPRKLALDAAQRKRLINSTSGTFRNLCIAMLYTGSRPAPGEIARCRVRDFNADLGIISIPTGKTGHRAVPLRDEAVRWFKSITAGKHPDALLLPKNGDGEPWGYNHQLKPMREAVERAKLPDETCMYTLRHSYATERLVRGAKIEELAEDMGTSTRMIEEHYRHVLVSLKRKALKATGFDLGLRIDRKAAALS